MLSIKYAKYKRKDSYYSMKGQYETKKIEYMERRFGKKF